MESYIIDGNNIVDTYKKVEELARSMRKDPRPVLLEFKTFRMRGHEEASGTKYVPKQLLNDWALRDPIENFKEYLRNEDILTETYDVKVRKKIAHEINENLSVAFAEDPVKSTLTEEINDVFKDFENKTVNPGSIKSKIRFVDAISKGLRQSMQRHKDLVVMGQDIAEYGGVFKVTEGFVEEFGKDRVRNTPICESAVIEAAYGLSVQGIKSVVELQFGDFISSGFNPVVNLLAKSHYRWAQEANVVLRMPCGAGVGAGPFHSQTNEAWFTKVPGLKVVYPAFPYDAKGLLNQSIEDPNPVLFFEHKHLYRSVYQEVPDDYYTLALGEASLVQEGDELSIITFGAGVHWAVDAVEKMGLSADILDLRTLFPLDEERIYQTVRKTGKVILLQEDSRFGGIAAELSALIGENCFESLDAPIRRVAAPDIPIPFAKGLEDLYLPIDRLEVVIGELRDY
jgi:2-oxoisovalerate dehydrogenase E1 component